jgi:ParB family chromosome partitioning protein
MPQASQVSNLQRLSTDAISLHPQIARQVDLQKSAQVRELARQIRLTGKCEPVLVRPHPEGTAGRYELLAYPQRWQAAIVAQLPRVPAQVCAIAELDARLQRLIALAADLRRNPMGTAEALEGMSVMLEMATHQDLAWLSGLSRTAVTHYLMLQDLPGPVRRLLQQGRLSFNHGKLLCARALTTHPDRQVQLASTAVEEGWSMRDLRQAIAGEDAAPAAATRQSAAPSAAPAALVDDPNIRRLAERLSEITGQPANLEHQMSGQGRLVFHYHSLDELDNVLRFFPIEES